MIRLLAYRQIERDSNSWKLHDYLLTCFNSLKVQYLNFITFLYAQLKKCISWGAALSEQAANLVRNWKNQRLNVRLTF